MTKAERIDMARRYRREAGLSPYALAKAAGLSPNALAGMDTDGWDPHEGTLLAIEIAAEKMRAKPTSCRVKS